MSRIELHIFPVSNLSGTVADGVRCVANKWQFQDVMMGEQFITFNVSSEKPIDWSLGDYCIFRGETYTLNYIPSVTQRARTGDRQDAYVYDDVKLESRQEELTRCLMLDITSTTGSYVAALGTNYTGSSKFTLFCGETVAGEPQRTLTAVCTLAAKMQANLDRMYGSNLWRIYVDTTSTYVNATGQTLLVTHTEDKQLLFDSKSVAQALSEVHNTFGLDYCIRGRSIYIGYNMANLTGSDDVVYDPSNQTNETFAFGYGKGYPSHSAMNTGLYQIKRIANSQQQIVTRLRVLGSTKNMPFHYYKEKYDLSQALFPTNLQLPDTFASPQEKAAGNSQRDQLYGTSPLTHLPYVRHVKGDTNDAYIDKNDDAAGSVEGIREGSVRFDGSGDLPEIYPTISEATYGELRGAGVSDQDGHTSGDSTVYFVGYANEERVDKLLAVGYEEADSLVDDANTGDGILPENARSSRSVSSNVGIGREHLDYNVLDFGDFNNWGNRYAGPEKVLMTVREVMPGNYGITPTPNAVYFSFGLTCYRDGCSCDVCYLIRIKQKDNETGAVTTLASYTSKYINISRASGQKEIALVELPDVGGNPQVSEIAVTSVSTITVTFTPIIRNIVVPSGFEDNFTVYYNIGNSIASNSITAEPEYTWFPIVDSSSYVESFHVIVQDMGFDIEASVNGDTPTLSMKSGDCVGRDFEIGSNIEKVTYNGKKGYKLTLKRSEDSSLHAYYPSQNCRMSAGDTFVLTGIQMPDAYVKMAEIRLLKAATDYLADNCDTQFTYQPYIDDIYLQRNYDNMVAAGTPELSIFWRLYAGLKFTFMARFTSGDEDIADELLTSNLTIAQVTIKMGDGLTPKVEMTLNDDIQQTTLQKLTTSVDRIYNGSLFSNGSGGAGTGENATALLSLLQSEGAIRFLSRKNDDVAEGKITFNDVVTHNAQSKFKKGMSVGNFQSRLLGSGALIDEEGNAEFESIYSRNFISTPEFRFNQITVTEGEQWCTNGYGTIRAVDIIDSTTGYITLKLEENEYASISNGDICRGMYNDISHSYETANLDDDTSLYASPSEGDGFGFSAKSGYFTSYFWVVCMDESTDPNCYNRRGECRFKYELRNSSTPHPCEFMKFAQYGSFTNASRRASCYSTSIGHYYEMVLEQVSTWKIQSANVVYRKGYLGDMIIVDKTHGERQLSGYGLYVQNNVYFGSAVIQLDPETLADLENLLNSYDVNFSGYVDVITVDDTGNCIGGLWTSSGENSEYRSYRIHSAISVRKNGTLLTLAPSGSDAGSGTYKIYAQARGCTCVVENSTLYITGINNIKDGVAGSDDDVNFDYNAMRNMDSCSVDLIIDCEGKGSIQKSFPITIKHGSPPFVGADITNAFSAVSWNTKTQSYVGLPIVFDMKMWHNNEFLDIESANNVSVTPSVSGMTVVKSIVTLASGQKVARITISALPSDLELVTELNVTASAIYAGVLYERTLVHTINKSTDTNVYQLQPSVNEVGITYNDNKQKVVSTNRVDCSVRCDSTDDKHYTIATSSYPTHGLYITSQIFSMNANNIEVGGNETPYNNLTGVAVSTDMTRIRFKLYKLMDITLSPLSALLEASNVISVLDTEDIPVVLDGLDGDNSIIVSLDNDNDTVMCNEDGSVIASTLPSAKARLLDGEETIGRTVLGTALAVNKKTLGNWSLYCHGCDAEFVGWVADSDNNDWVHINVTSVTDDVASVDVKCQYTKHGVAGNYVSLLSIKKLYGLDKYEIITTPTAITYNPNTNTHSPSSFTVYVYLTTQEEDRHVMVTLPYHDTVQNGDVRLMYSTDNGGTWTRITEYNNGKVLSSSLFSSVTSGAVLLRVEKYFMVESSGSWVVYDEEAVDITRNGQDGKGVEFIFFQTNSWDGTDADMPTIYDDPNARQTPDGNPYCPYTDAQHTAQWTDESVGVGVNSRYEFYAKRVKVNGVWQPFGGVNLWNRYTIDGVSPYLIDLSNEQSFVNCDDNGNVLDEQNGYETSDVMIFLGSQSKLSDFTIKVVPVNISCNGYYPNGGTAVTGQTQCDVGGFTLSADNNGNYRLTPSHITANSATISVTATKGSLALVAVYKVNKNIAGQNGVIYSLIPSLNVIHKNYNETYRDTELSVQVNKISGATVSELTTKASLTAEGLVLTYQGSHSSEVEPNSISGLSTATLCGTASFTKLFLRKISNQTLLDSERINVVKDGKDGEDGQDGVSPYLMDLSNEMDCIRTDDSGTVLITSYVKTGIDVYQGTSSVPFSVTGIKHNGTPMSGNVNNGWSGGGVSISYNSSTKEFTVTYSTYATIFNGKDELTYIVQVGNTTLEKNQIVNGVSGDIYNVQPVTSHISVSRPSSTTYDPSTYNLTCGYTCKHVDGSLTNGSISTNSNDNTSWDIAGKYNLFFSLRLRSNGSWSSYCRYSSSSSYGYNNNLATLNLSSYDAIEFVLCTAQGSNFSRSSLSNYTVIDRETVPVVYGGVPGDAGASAVSYWITSSLSSVTIGAGSSSAYTPAFTLYFYKQTGGSAAEYYTGCTYRIYKRSSDGSLSLLTGPLTSSNGTASLSANTYSLNAGESLVIRIYADQSTSIWLAEYVIVTLKVGDTGHAGKSIYFWGKWSEKGSNDTFTVSDYETCFVLYTDSYYYLFVGANGTYTKSTSGTPGSSSNWANKVSEFSVIVSQAIFTDFAKLGSAVFNKDWMFSQYGLRGNRTPHYTQMSPTSVNSVGYDIGFSTSTIDWTSPYNNLTPTSVRVINGHQYQLEVVAIAPSSGSMFFIPVIDGTELSADDGYQIYFASNPSGNYQTTRRTGSYYTASTTKDIQLSVNMWVGSSSYSGTLIRIIWRDVNPWVPEIALDWLNGYAHFSAGKARFEPDGTCYIRGLSYGVAEKNTSFTVGDEDVYMIHISNSNINVTLPHSDQFIGREITLIAVDNNYADSLSYQNNYVFVHGSAHQYIGGMIPWIGNNDNSYSYIGFRFRGGVVKLQCVPGYGDSVSYGVIAQWIVVSSTVNIVSYIPS